MSDYESDQARANRRAREKREWDEANTEFARAQRLVDFHWQMRLTREAEAAARRRAPDERSRDGSDVLTDWSPIARFERETGRR
jgi:hypothetical protein